MAILQALNSMKLQHRNIERYIFSPFELLQGPEKNSSPVTRTVLNSKGPIHTGLIKGQTLWLSSTLLGQF
jgi:hypothetical protein